MPTTEERLAALEKQMAAWMDQRPTTYYTHQYSGEEIDAATGRALTGGALDTSVSNVSNQLGTFVRPNLLDNWYFGRPVNQRGQTEYTGKVYGVDRWSSLSNIVTMVVGDDGLTVSSTAESGAVEICQYFESYIKAGTILTLSAIVSKTEASQGGILRVKVYGGGADLQANLPARAMDHELVSVTNAARADVIGCVMRISNGDGYTVHAIKLELGDTQTLAHQDSAGNWVLNEVPDYGEQLRRCQRYYLITSAKHFFSGWANTGSTGFIFVPVPTQMRIKPIITVLAGGTFIQNDKTASLTAANFELESADAVGLKIKLSGLNCSTGPFTVADSQIAFSADL